MANKVVSCSGVSKHYNEVEALKNIDLEIVSGEIFGLIGPDGAGKTSFFRLVASLLIPDEGAISVFGFDTVKEFQKIRPRLGYMPGRFSLYSDLTVEENLAFYASVFGTTIKRNYHLIEDIYRQIEPFKKRRAGKLSGGMKQKLALSCALIHSPEILILDEPTTGVDAVSRREFWEMLAKLKSNGITILVSTPYMDEAKRCDKIALLQNGSLLSVDPPEKIISKLKVKLFSIRSNKRHEILNALKSYEPIYQAYQAGQLVHFSQLDSGTIKVQQYLEERGFTDFDIMAAEPDIEDCFINLMMK